MPSVAIVGASPKPDRYSHQAVLRYRERNWTVWPVHPSGAPVAELPTLKTLAELPARPDIVCLYVNPDLGLGMVEAIAQAAPTLVWLNPGSESPALRQALEARGLRVVEACTLVVLAQGDPLEIALRRE
jgi:uncharacterized protein